MNWRRLKGLHCVAVLVVTILATCRGRAGDSIVATITPLAAKVRPDAPAWVDVHVQSSLQSIHTGRLEFAAVEWENDQNQYLTHELAIAPGRQNFRFLLPARIADPRREMELRFVTRDQKLTLGRYRAFTNLASTYPLVVGVLRSSNKAPGETEPWQMVRLEQFLPQTLRSIETIPAFLEPGDVTSDPLGLLPFDLIVAEPRAFESLKEKSREALLRWLAAGGSVLLSIGPEFSAESAASLDAILARDPNWTTLGTDPFSSVQSAGGIKMGRAEFGRIVIANIEGQSAEPSPKLRDAITWLWRVRKDVREEITKSGRWPKLDEKDPSFIGPVKPPSHQLGHSLSTINKGFAVDALPMSSLQPKQVRLVPLPVLAALLVLVVVAIGPGDWLFLGAIRQRRLTWIVFPCVTIIATLAVVFFARQYLGRTHHRRLIVVSDIGTSDRIIRETRLDYHFVGQEVNHVESIENAVQALAFPKNGKSVCRGQFPAKFDFVHSQNQWTQRLTRSFRILDAPDDSGAAWDTFKSEELKRGWAGLLGAQMSPDKRYGYDFFHAGKARPTGMGPLGTWRVNITDAPDRDLGQLLFQISPNGSARLDDLTFFETGDESMTVLLAARSVGDDIHIWRRLYLH